ncbi:MAG TPA: 16S rRNA (guanine(966)-N(2))-methyltransferase RsmD [Stellaceae bacterium]|nr:16S rRNA (guanine(966)-N(2))-methyltransferase RsmD [Stellaceae bacterium]
MRIVAGRHRGREIAAPEGFDVRPTSDRARQALFNILEHGRFAASGSPFAGQRVLDAFAGTGALGLEALSRGAAEAVFMETAPAARQALAANIKRLGEGERCQVLAADATAPPRAVSPCAVAFLDPPYRSGLGTVALAALAGRGWLLPGALAVLEVAAREEVETPAGFVIEEERVYGAARLVFLRRIG